MTDKSLRNNRTGVFSNVRVFVVCLSLLQLVQVMGSGYGKSALTSIQRRYQLTTFAMGLLQSCFHIGNLTVILFVSYFGSKWNRPRAIAIGTLMMAASSLISALPQFIGCRYRISENNNFQTSYDFHVNERGNFYGTNLSDFLKKVWDNSDKTNPSDWFQINPFYSESTPILCQNNDRNYTNKAIAVINSNSPTSPYFEKLIHIASKLNTSVNVSNGTYGRNEEWDDSQLYILIAIGSLIKGMGHSPLHPLGMSYIDDHATVRNSAVYIGIVSALSLLGPAFGFILGSLTTNTWVDWGWVPIEKYAGIDPADKEWVGAWWLGYIVTAILLLIATFPFCLFPRSCKKEVDEDYVVNDESCLFCIKTCYANQDRGTDPENTLKSRSLKGGNVDKEISDTEHITTGNMVTDKDMFENQFVELLNNQENNNISLETKSDLLRSFTVAYSPSSRAQLSTRSWYEISLNQDKKTQVVTYLEKNDWKRRHSILTHQHKNDSDLIPYNRDEFISKLGGRRHISYDSIPLQLKKSASASRMFERNHSTKSHLLYRNHNRAPTSIRSKSSNRKASLSIPHLPIGEFFKALKGLLTDSAFLCVTMAFVCLTSFLAASVTYAAKYMETQFNLTASFANLLNGSVNLPMAVVGNLLGGWCIRRFNLNIHKTMCVAVTGLVVTLILILVLLVLGCEPDKGASVDMWINKSTACSLSCDCDQITNPVCDVVSNITYRSACHAGCTKVKFWRGTEIYSGCSCLIEHGVNFTAPNIASVPETYNRFLLSGPCKDPDCSHSYLPIFVATMGFASLAAGIASTPSSLVILRIVPPTDKAIAIAVSFVFTRILAWIPSPVYVGSAIDASCLRWSQLVHHKDDVIDYESKSRHHCDMYDKNLLRRNFFAVTGAQLICGILFYAVAIKIESKRSNLNLCRRNLSQSLKTLEGEESLENAMCKTNSTKAALSDDDIEHCESELQL